MIITFTAQGMATMAHCTPDAPSADAKEKMKPAVIAKWAVANIVLGDVRLILSATSISTAACQ